jgi:SPP1 family predicted phage head-tail adaptor
LRERIQIERLGDDITDSGTPSGEWTEVCSVRADVESTAGKEGYEANQNTARLTHLVTLRYRSDIGPEMRVVWGARIFQIHAAIPDRRRTELTLQCEERLE